MLFAILLFGFAAYVTYSAHRGRMLAPLNIYTCWLWLYPIAAGFLFSDVGGLPAIVQPFTPAQVDEFLSLSVACLLGLVSADALFRDQFHLLARPIAGSERVFWRRDIFSVSSLLFSAIFVGYVVENRDIFLDGYIYQLFRADAGDARIATAINISSGLEILLIMAVFSRLIIYRALGGYVLIAVLLYLGVKVMIGSRLMIVPLALGVAYMLNPRGILARKLGAAFGIIGGISFFVLLNFIRRDGVNVSEALMDSASEFLFAVISAMHSIDMVAQGRAPDGFALLFDGVLGVVPSALLGGDKAAWLTFERWKDSIGGAAFLSPVGGYYLPGQIYLIFKSKLLCYLFFLGFGFLVKKCTAQLSRSGARTLWALVPLQVITFGIVFGVRTEFWVLEKMFLQQFILLTLLVVSGYAMWRRLRYLR